MFRIFIKNLRLYGYHGVREYEKKNGQFFIFNINVYINDTGFAGSDRLEKTISYSDVIKKVREINDSKRFELLETFCQYLASSIRDMSELVERADVIIEKPSPPIEEKLDSVGVGYSIKRKDKATPIKDLNKSLNEKGHKKPEKRFYAFLSVGSNMGNRKANIKKGLRLISDNPSVDIEKISSLYETEPMYLADQKNFYNIAVQIAVKNEMDPFQLLGLAKGIEYYMGRKKAEKRYGPRPIDIDILFFNNERIVSDILQIPHPRMSERRFVLVPLCEIAPDIEVKGMDIKSYLEEKKLSGMVRRISDFEL
jgi:2-amino-4-hydroxy-6-hydroxymethyldihydropteridine diphosphokinase/dihydroneopterin aldolase